MSSLHTFISKLLGHVLPTATDVFSCIAVATSVLLPEDDDFCQLEITLIKNTENVFGFSVAPHQSAKRGRYNPKRYKCSLPKVEYLFGLDLAN